MALTHIHTQTKGPVNCIIFGIDLNILRVENVWTLQLNYRTTSSVKSIAEFLLEQTVKLDGTNFHLY